MAATHAQPLPVIEGIDNNTATAKELVCAPDETFMLNNTGLTSVGRHKCSLCKEG